MARRVNCRVLGAANIATERVIPVMNRALSAMLLAVASGDEQKARAVAKEFGIRRRIVAAGTSSSCRCIVLAVLLPVGLA
jgi:predicted dehydrogenase